MYKTELHFDRKRRKWTRNPDVAPSWDSFDVEEHEGCLPDSWDEWY